MSRAPTARLTLDVRGNEIGFEGKVPAAGHARYAEVARWTMFRDPAFAVEGKLRAGVARAQTFQLHAPITYPCELRVETWIERLGNTSMDFGHRFVEAKGDRLFAEGRVTVVQLDENGPSKIDPSLGELTEARGAPRPLEAPEPPTRFFERQLVVSYSDLDQFGHVNQARYVDLLDDARLWAAREGDPAGFEGTVAAFSVEYLAEVLVGDELTLRLGGEGGAVRTFEIRRERDAKVVHRARIAPAAATAPNG